MHQNNKQQMLTKHQELINAGSTPGLNFQISTMNEEDQQDTYQSARIQGSSSHGQTNGLNNPSITLQRVTITQPDHTHSTSRMHPNYIDATTNHLESQVHSTLVALDQQSQSLINNQQSAESLNMNLIDDSTKENQQTAFNYYEQENRKLKVMNEKLLQEIS